MQAAVDIKFSCATCGQRMLVDPSAAGHVTSCPGCDTEVTVPLSGELEEQEYSVIQEDGSQFEADGALHNGTASSEREWGDVHHQLEAATEAARRLEAVNAQLQAERQTLTDDLAFARQRLASAETQLGTSNRELSLSRGNVAQLEESLRVTAAERAELAGTQVSLEWKLAELEASLRNAEAECARLKVVGEELLRVRSQMSQLEWERDELRRECEQINRDLANTENGRELTALRAREKALEREKLRISKALETALDDASRYEASHERARTELEELHRRCVAAEKLAASLSVSELGRDNEILRGILGRQKEELEQRFRELVKLRRAKFGLRLTYWLFATGALGVFAYALKVLVDLFGSKG